MNTGSLKARLRNGSLAALAATIALSGCSFISGSRPIAVTESDRDLLEANEKAITFNIPFLRAPINEGAVDVYKVAFDGTMNDAADVPPGERSTLVAHIAQKIDAKYYPGPGKQNLYFLNWLDGATGFTSRRIAEQAEKDFFSHASTWLASNPNGEIRVFITGFSRGAAIARHFMNVVERDWSTSPVGMAHPEKSPHFYALLIDTVATGQMESLQLSLPKSLDYLVHMIAKDEPRSLFVPVIDTEDPGPDFTSFMHGIPGRVNVAWMPGAHSDLGASYSDGIGDMYREMAEQLLSRFGLLAQNCWESRVDPSAFGKHDSRGVIDRLVGSGAPNSERSVPRLFYPVPVQKMSAEERRAIYARLSQLIMANAERNVGTLSIRSQEKNLVFRVRREDQDLRVESTATPYMDLSSIKFYIQDGLRRLDFQYLDPGKRNISSLVITDDIWKRLPQGEVATLSYETLRSGGKSYLETHVNDVLVRSIEVKEDSQRIHTDTTHCKIDESGTPVSPIQVFIFHSTNVQSNDGQPQ